MFRTATKLLTLALAILALTQNGASGKSHSTSKNDVREKKCPSPVHVGPTASQNENRIGVTASTIANSPQEISFGQWVPVEDLHDSGVYEQVYNLRVADFHTYFVGGEDWSFSVWVHNTYSTGSSGKKSKGPTTPNAAAKKAVQGGYVDPLTNKPVKTKQTLAADHIFPAKEIRQLPGFSKLTPQQQAQVLNYAKNFQGLPQTANSSKGARVGTDFKTIKGQSVNANYQQNLAARQQALKAELQGMINGFLGGS